MKISVAMCTYNGETYILEQLKSIINQTKQVDEIIICDDCSSDQTTTLVEKALNNTSINYKLIKNEKNMGFKKNFYKVLSLCTGDIIFLCDQDDVWMENKVEAMYQKFEENKEALLVFSNGEVTDKDLNYKISLFESISFKKDYMKSNDEILKHILADNYVTGAAAALKKELLDFAMPFPEKWAHDYWLGVIAAINNGLYYVDEMLFKYRQHENNTIGVNKKVNMNLLKRLFAKREDGNKNRDNLYAEIRLPLLEALIDYCKMKNVNKVYYGYVLDNYHFWKKRENFANSNVIKNSFIVLKDVLSKQQEIHRNTSHPVLKDFIKGIALANKNK